MDTDFIDCESLFRVVVEHAQNEVLEVFTQVICANSLEILFRLSLDKQAVVLVVLLGLEEGESAFDQDEENDCDRKEVYSHARVRLAFLNLGSHVRLRASIRGQSVNVDARRFEASEAEVSNMEIHVVVNQDVF